MSNSRTTKQNGTRIIFILTALLSYSTSLQSAKSEKAYLKAKPEIVQQWRDLKFGLFIHWGPVSLKGTEIGWSRGGERRGRTGRGSIPAEIYDNLYKEFNPVKFNAREWVKIAQDAGMKYLVFTSKHHDGFSMFDTKHSEYKISNSPFKRDVVKELADACHDAGIQLGYYYSPPDWYHPDYRTQTHDKYIRFMHNQLREICTNYGRIDIIWFDGLGGTSKDWDSDNLFKMIRDLQPDVIINNRAGLAADYDTPEQRIGSFQAVRPWETCMTICRQWAWKPNDQMKSLQQCLHTLVRVVGGNGNLLFNVGPMPDGRIEPRQVQRLKKMGDWLKQYDQTIYDTRGGPFKPGPWGASTHKGNTIFLHLLNPEQLPLLLPPVDKKIVAHEVLTGGTATITQTKENILINVPPNSRRDINTIIKLTLNGPASEIAPVNILSDSLTAGKKAKASNVYRNQRAYGPDKAIDDDSSTRWATDSGVQQAWLEINLGKNQTFNRARIREAYGRVQNFELQYQKDNQWTTFLVGKKIGDDWSKTFKPITAQLVRLNILQAADGPTIYEFQLFAPKEK